METPRVENAGASPVAAAAPAQFPGVPDAIATALKRVAAEWNALTADRDRLAQENTALNAQVASLTAQLAALLPGHAVEQVLPKQVIGITPPADTLDALHDVESRVGTLGGRSVYRKWGQDVATFTDGLADDAASGRVTLVRVKPPGAAPAGWRQVAAGGDAIDGWLTTVVKAAYALNPRLVVVFHHEPIDDDPSGAAAFVAASDHFYDVVKAAAPNVVVGPIFMLWWDLQRSSGHHLDDWVPHRYDVVGGDPYPAVKPGKGILTPEQAFGPCVDFARKLGVPLIVAETGVADDRPDPARAEALDAALTYCAQHADVIRGVFLFDTNVNKHVEGVGFLLSPAMEEVLKAHLASTR